MRSRLKLLALAIGCLLAAAVSVGAIFLLRPGTLLTSRTAGAALRYFGAAASPRWSRLSFFAEASTARRHRYRLHAENLCAGDRPGVFAVCFSEFELSAVVSYSWRGPVVERIDNFVAISDGARLDLRRLRGGGAPFGVPARLRPASVGTMNVALSRFVIVSSDTTVSGGLRVTLTPEAQRPLSAEADLLLRGLSGTRRWKGDLAADTALLPSGAPSFIDVIGRADLGSSGKAKIAFRLRREADRYAGTGNAEVALSSGPLRFIRLIACQGSAPLGSGAAPAASGALSCRYELVPARAVSRHWGGIKTVTGQASLSGRRDGENFAAALEADLAPMTTWYELTGALEVRAHGRRDQPLDSATVTHGLRASFKVPRFSDLVALLRGTKYAVPAPIHVLKGPLAFAIESRGDPRADRQTASYRFSSDLRGSRQKLALRASGEVRIAAIRGTGRLFEHAGELILTEVALELPRLDIGRVPRIFFDKRIQSGRPGSAIPPGGKPLPLRSRLTVRTGKPLLLFSNLIKDPVPVVLDLTAAYPPAAAAGVISLRKFDMELFRRSATLHHLNLSLSSGTKVGALEGLILYPTPHAAISIRILGDTEKPRIEFASVPPMKREAIIALLIFGKSPDELDSQQAASVGNTQTALESRAFGLASLFLFGATPVEHVGYDSVTKTATVKLRLPGGTNLELDSDFDRSRELRLRKLLAPHWAIQSEVTDQEAQSTGATTFLEWFNQY